MERSNTANAKPAPLHRQGGTLMVRTLGGSAPRATRRSPTAYARRSNRQQPEARARLVARRQPKTHERHILVHQAVSQHLGGVLHAPLIPGHETARTDRTGGSVRVANRPARLVRSRLMSCPASPPGW